MLFATNTTDDESGLVSFSDIPPEVVADSIIPGLPFYYDLLSLALTSSVNKEIIFSRILQTVPGIREGPRFWPLKLLFESLLKYRRELKTLSDANDQTSKDLAEVKTRLERQIEGMKGMVNGYFKIMDQHPMHPIDRIDLHALHDAIVSNTVKVPNRVHNQVPGWYMMVEMLHKVSDKALEVPGGFYKFSPQAMSHQMKPFGRATMTMLMLELVDLQEAGLLPSINFDKDDPQYDGNIERLFKANGGSFEIDMSRLDGTFIFTALIVSDPDQLPALLKELSDCPQLMTSRVLSSLYLLIKCKKWDNLRQLLPELGYWSKPSINTMLIQLALTGFHAEDVLRIVFGDDRIDAILSLVEGNDSCQRDEHFIPLLFALTKQPDAAFEERLANYLAESNITPPPKCLMMAYLQGYSVNFLRQVWDIPTAVKSTEWSEAIGRSRAMALKVSANRPPLYMGSSVPVENRTFLLEDGTPAPEELALVMDFLRYSSCEDSTYVLLLKAFPDTFFAATLKPEWKPQTMLTPKQLALWAWMARRIETVRKIKEIFADSEGTRDDVLSKIYSEYPEALHQEIKDTLLGSHPQVQEETMERAVEDESETDDD